MGDVRSSGYDTHVGEINRGGSSNLKNCIKKK